MIALLPVIRQWAGDVTAARLSEWSGTSSNRVDSPSAARAYSGGGRGPDVTAVLSRPFNLSDGLIQRVVAGGGLGRRSPDILGTGL